MNVAIIQQRLNTYQCKTPLDEENAIKEITQEVALMALARANFFRVASFHGGTALRILYGLQRFSEDLDFALQQPNEHFKWSQYFDTIDNELKNYGYQAEFQERSKADQNIKKAFLKDNSIGKVLILHYPSAFHRMKKIRIKLEIDINPPSGAQSELRYLDYPLPFSVRAQTLPSSFSGKIHALLCRNYMKGRDWYDFIWYVAMKTDINYPLLSSALYQTGSWARQSLEINKPWILSALEQKILAIDWQQAAQDVSRFLKPNEQKSLELWHQDFFMSLLQKL